MVIAIVPSRLHSSRFPGKALATVAGIPLVALVVERTLSSGVADQVWLATDDARIADAVAARCAGAEVHLDDCARFVCGSDRVAALAARLELAPDDVILNVQGDEALVNAEVLEAALAALALDGAAMGTVAAPLAPTHVDEPDVVKVTVGGDGLAGGFSRRSLDDPGQLAHIGIYAFTAGSLRAFAALPPGRAEAAQGLEQLRAVEHGMTIGVARVRCASLAVNRPEDIPRVEAELA
jgi:3-deoxy-manno-octulosonate cytidylyltransferase (CMP-KDO synthetase)